MNIKLLNAFAAFILFLTPGVILAQTVPNLGTAANFVLFTTVGAVTNSGIPHLTHLTGNVASNSGSSTGFGNVDGVMDDGTVASGQSATDLLTAYLQLNSEIPTFFPSSLLGNGDTLTAGVYYIPAPATLNLNLILDAKGDPNAVFIFQIQGALSANAASKIILVNGAMACNVFWKVEGLVSIAAGTTMRGTIIAHNAAINLNANDTLEGRALSINGAITTNSILAYIPIGCGSPVLTGPAAPALVSTAAYGIFSSIGPVTNTGVTYVTGDVGTNSGLTTGFDSSDVTGMIHPVPDASTAASAGDLTNVYNYLNTLTPDINLLYPAQFGNDLVLTPHTYHMGAVLTFTGNIYLNAEGNPNAVFVLQINGAFSTSTFSKIILINGAQAKNVYWKVDGAVHIYDNSLFNGTIVAAGAITLNNADTVSGRVLTINGAIDINGSDIAITSDSACVAPPIGGTFNVCKGFTTILTDSAAGGTWASLDTSIATIDTSGKVTGVTPGTATIKYISPAGCVNTATVTVNPSPAPITGPGSVCVGSSITLSDTSSNGIWSSSNPSQATIGSISGLVTGIAKGIPTITYTVANGCIAIKPIIVGAYAGSITGPSNVCRGSSITLADSIIGGTWSAGNTKAAVIGGVVIGISAGIDTIMYAVTDFCGTDTAIKIVTIDTFQNAGIITGPSSVCVGSSITLTDNTPGGIWSSNAKALVILGHVTGIVPGIDTIRYVITNACGTDTAAKTITINPLQNAGNIIGPSNVCVGSVITLVDGAPGGTWSSSNATATVVGGSVTGITAGIDTVVYTVTNICGVETATKAITVNPLPYAGIITGASSVCVGSSITLTDTASGGTWSADNATALVVSNTVFGIIPGIDTIVYTVSNLCGTDTTTKTITVNPLPYAGLITGPSTVCAGASITLTDNTPGGVWNGSNATATVVNGVVTGVIAGMDTIVYTVTNVCGIDTVTKTVTINPLPDAGVITGPSTVCVGSSVTMIDTASGGTWSGSNNTALVLGNLVLGTIAGVDTISYSVTGLGCTATTVKTITINPLPYAGSITGPSNVCVGSSITLTDATTGGVWSSSNTMADVSGSIVTGVSPGVDTIIYTATNVCGSATAKDVIAIYPIPSVPVISTQSPSSLCAGTMYQNFGAATLPPVGDTYNWTATNAVVWAQGTSDQYSLINFNTPGTANVTLTATAAGSTCRSQATVTVNVSTDISQTPEVVYFNNHFVCTPSNEDSYQWGYDNINTFDSTILIGAVNQDYLNESPYFAENLYWVITTSGSCLQKTYYITPTVVQSVSPDAASVSIYPNPANNLINVTINSAVYTPIQVDVFNMLGQKLNSVLTINNKATIDVISLPAGPYLITCLRNGIKITSATFIKN